jgi:hypothetical protein
MTISEIEKEFDEKFVRKIGEAQIRVADKFPAEYIERFIRSKFTELLESLRMEEMDMSDGYISADARNEWVGHNRAVQEINKRIDDIKTRYFQGENNPFQGNTRNTLNIGRAVIKPCSPPKAIY